MRCPYCVSEIADEALACPRCTRDLYLFKPLLEKIGQLEKAVAEQAQALSATSLERIAALEQELAALRTERVETAAMAAAVVEAVAPEAPAAPSTGYAATIAQAVIPALLLLVLAHWTMLFVYDVKPLYLRVATILIPVPFGFLLAYRYPAEFRKSIIAGTALAFAGVLAMLTVTAVIDKVALLPESPRDWRETLEYVLSIALAFVPNEEGKLGIEKAVKQLSKLQSAVTPAATGAAAVYAGVKSYLGSLG